MVLRPRGQPQATAPSQDVISQVTHPRPGHRRSGVSKALAADRLGVPAVLFFVLAGVAPLTVTAGVIPTAYATTGLTGIPAAFLVIAVILGIFAAGYVTIARHISNAGACYAFIARGLGRPAGVAGALVALLAYSFLQIGLVRHEALCVPGGV
jgi:amino acid transporter